MGKRRLAEAVPTANRLAESIVSPLTDQELEDLEGKMRKLLANAWQQADGDAGAGPGRARRAMRAAAVTAGLVPYHSHLGLTDNDLFSQSFFQGNANPMRGNAVLLIVTRLD